MKTINAPITDFLSFDIEADGPCSGLYSMISLGMVYVPDPSQSFYATFRPISDQYIPNALAVSKFTREQTLAFEAPEVGMKALEDWLQTLDFVGRPIPWSDNPGFDWQFLNYYCHRYLGKNPLGHSCRRIGDFFAGLQHNARATKQWNRFKLTKHSHNALDDAKGNAEALRTIFGHPNKKD